MDSVQEALEKRGVVGLSLTPLQKLEHACGWYIGDPALAKTFLRWAKEAGYTIKES